MMNLAGPGTTLSRRKSYVHGRYVNSTSGEVFTSINPATNTPICDVEQAGPAELDAAVESASAGYEVWRNTPAVERQRILLRAVAILRDRNDELAHLETLDSGKPLQETLEIDVVTGADVVEYYAGLTQTLHGTTVDFPGEGFARMRREPLGVCAGIGAWNYPIQIAMWKSGPALACGNAMIFKPAELTPVTAGLLAEIYSEAGLPDGVFNVVQGDARVGQMLTTHPGIAKVSLTGEVTTGKAVMAAAAGSLKIVDCTDDMGFVTDEVFGPLMAVLPFGTEDEVLARANATHYGLSGAVFTRDFSRAHRVADAIEAGIVWINDYNITPPGIPFGGYKQSGLGRENGLAAIEHYTQVKTIYANLGDVGRTY